MKGDWGKCCTDLCYSGLSLLCFSFFMVLWWRVKKRGCTDTPGRVGRTDEASVRRWSSAVVQMRTEVVFMSGFFFVGAAIGPLSDRPMHILYVLGGWKVVYTRAVNTVFNFSLFGSFFFFFMYTLYTCTSKYTWWILGFSRGSVFILSYYLCFTPVFFVFFL